jgi:hypothetical protein
VTAFQQIRPAVLAVLMVLASSRPVVGQVKNPIARGDFNGSIGWLVVQKDDRRQLDDGGNDWHSSFYGGAGTGWYWNDHLKTELDFGAGSEAHAYSSRPITLQGRITFVTSQSSFEQRTLALSQQYQFFRNVWFHPHIAAGANITWERVTEEIYPVTIYEPPGPPRLIERGRIEGPRTNVTVSPFVATGFKAYMSRRAFFRTDLRVSFRGGVDDVLVRMGLGIDY